jgi:hypothetical protein
MELALLWCSTTRFSLQIKVKYPISGVVAMKYCMDGGRKPKHEQLEMLMHLTKSQIE